MAQKFKIGDNVHIHDHIYGRVNGIVTDTTRDTVFVKWDDCSEPVEHSSTTHEILVNNSKKPKIHY